MKLACSCPVISARYCETTLVVIIRARDLLQPKGIGSRSLQVAMVWRGQVPFHASKVQSWSSASLGSSSARPLLRAPVFSSFPC